MVVLVIWSLAIGVICIGLLWFFCELGSKRRFIIYDKIINCSLRRDFGLEESWAFTSHNLNNFRLGQSEELANYWKKRRRK